MRWVEIAVGATDESADAVTSIMTEEGCAGTAINEVSGKLKVESPKSGTTVLGYLPVDDTLESRLALIRDRVRALPDFGLEVSGEIEVKWVRDEEWATAWKAFFHPLKIGKIVIKPSWEGFEATDGEVVVEIDPGMAFGTGNHPTTQLCLMALQDCIRGAPSILDVGTGSGILAIAAARLGAARVVGLDIDSVAVEAARANVERLGLGDVVHIELADGPVAFDGAADLVVANIIANTIIAMSGDLRASLRPGGKLIASGIILDRLAEVRSALESAGLRILEERRDGEWVAIISEWTG